MDAVKACYGRMFGRLERCEACEERVWCRDAADPKPLTGPHAGPTGNDAAFETAEAMEAGAAEVVDDLSEVRRLAARLIREILRQCDGNRDRLRLYLMRLEGMSLAEIGAVVRKTKQAVHKDVVALERGSAALGKVLRAHHPESPWRRVRDEVIAAAFCRARERWPDRKLTGPTGVYAWLARRYGLVSWIAARDRVRRCSKVVDAATGLSRDGVAPG